MYLVLAVLRLKRTGKRVPVACASLEGDTRHAARVTCVVRGCTRRSYEGVPDRHLGLEILPVH